MGASAAEAPQKADTLLSENDAEGWFRDEPAIPCTHSDHVEWHRDFPAAYIVQTVCWLCGDQRRYPICIDGWANFVDWTKNGDPVHCHVCDGFTRPDVRIVEVLNG